MTRIFSSPLSRVSRHRPPREIRSTKKLHLSEVIEQLQRRELPRRIHHRLAFAIAPRDCYFITRQYTALQPHACFARLSRVNSQPDILSSRIRKSMSGRAPCGKCRDETRDEYAIYYSRPIVPLPFLPPFGQSRILQRRVNIPPRVSLSVELSTVSGDDPGETRQILREHWHMRLGDGE